MSASAAARLPAPTGLQLRVSVRSASCPAVAARQYPRAVAEQNDAVGIVGDHQTIERARLRQIVLVRDDAFDPGVGRTRCNARSSICPPSRFGCGFGCGSGRFRLGCASTSLFLFGRSGRI